MKRRNTGWISHPYISTYCQHDDHKHCRLYCKLCTAPCICPCHQGRDPLDTVEGDTRIAHGPGSSTWAAECREFGCDDTGAARVGLLEYTVLVGIVALAVWLYWLAGR